MVLSTRRLKKAKPVYLAVLVRRQFETSLAPCLTTTTVTQRLDSLLMPSLLFKFLSVRTCELVAHSVAKILHSCGFDRL